ncbi:MAG: hypothetical protein U9R57_14690 [Thermodesulfobacteriota bacterium]|nr:hypothetical protein [Thermodesulfobacteriota bacterium]
MAAKEKTGSKMQSQELIAVEKLTGVPCCPELDTDKSCDVIDFRYRLIHNPLVSVHDRHQRIPVEVLLHVRLERCPGPLALGDLAYSTTLFPGEKVRLFSMDRRTRFSYDSSTSLSYRHEQTSEERYYMSSMDDFMSDLTIRDEGKSANRNQGSFESKGKTSGALQSFFGGASLTVNGSYDSESTSSFMRELSQHAEASHNRSIEATRTANSVSVGEVQSRTHAEGESEDSFEAASRIFSNPNKCHAITFFFYQINKTQRVKLTLEAIHRRVVDPTANTEVSNKPFVTRGEVEVIPGAVLSTDSERLKKEDIGRACAVAQVNESVRLAPSTDARLRSTATVYSAMSLTHQIEPITREVRAAAIKSVDKDLASVGLLNSKTGEVSKEAGLLFEFEVKTSIPTPGLFVRSCLDDCNICEPTLQREIQLALQRKQLENKLLERQIELLEKSQEYRCCPNDSPENGDD